MFPRTDYTFSTMQSSIFVACTTFVTAIWLNRLFMWCLLPVCFLFTRKCYPWIVCKPVILDSSWIIHIVYLIGYLQRTLKPTIKSVKCVSQEYSVTTEMPNSNKKTDNTVEKQSAVLIDYIIRDFVHSWVSPITNDNDCTVELREVISSLKNMTFERLMRLDKYGCLQVYIELFQKHLKNYQESKQSLKIQPNYRLKRERDKEFKTFKSVHDFMANRNMYHQAMLNEEQEFHYMCCLLQTFFSETLNPLMYNCTPCVELITMIISASVLVPFMELLSQPYFLHVAIIKLTSDNPVVGFEKHVTLNRNCVKTSIREGSLSMKADQNIVRNTSSEQCVLSNPNVETLSTDILNKSADMFQEKSYKSEVEERPSFSITSENLFTPFSNEADISHIQIEEAEDACLISFDTSSQSPKNLFIMADIINTENVKEATGNSLFTLYNIKYECWQEVDGIWDKHTNWVKRRYREFVTLQERLEDHPKLRHLLKGVHGPAKWFRLPFGNTGEATVEKRKQELQLYLQEIISKTELNNSMAFREFMAYNGDVSIAFVKKPSDLYVFDQVVINTMRRMSSIFGKWSPNEKKGALKKTMHSAPVIAGSIYTWPVDEDALQLFTSPKQRTSNDITETMSNLVVDFDKQIETSESTDADDKAYYDALENSFISRKDIKERSNLDKQTLLAASLLDLALQTVETKNCWFNKDSVVILFKVLIAKFLDVFIKNEVDDASTSERCTYYLELITETIWPDGILDTTSMNPSQEQKQKIRQQARQCLHDFFPGFLPLILGQENFEYSVDEVMDSLDHPKINKHFAYCLLDVMLETIFPEVTSGVVQERLLKVNKEKCHHEVETEDEP